MEDNITYKEIVKQYGYEAEGAGNWEDYNLECPECKENTLEIDIDLELVDQGGAAQKEPIKCPKCGSSFNVGYIFRDPLIVLEKL